VPQIRVMTYNIWMGGRGGPLLDQAVVRARADVVLVNESPKTPLLWQWRVRDLAERWQMRHVVGGRSAGSNMIATTGTVGVRSTYAATLPQPLGQPRRGVATAQLRVQGRLLGVVSCHLSLRPERRAWEVEEVIAAAGRLRGPVVVAGDLNEPPRGPSWQRLREVGYVDHGSRRWATFPAVEPVKRIDALLVRGPASVLHHGDPGIGEPLLRQASDHRPVLAVLEL
jgi:endonuclease/exonuclease/phosphatase family metal-dependent hydrolase